MANIIQLEDSSGSVFYPQTHEKAVIDSDGVTLEEKLQGIPTSENIETDDLFLDNGKLKFANRAYNSTTPNGLGYVIIREGSSFASQVVATNTVYEIRHKVDLSSATVTLPTNCVLNFVGGSIDNGTLELSDCQILGTNSWIGTSLTISGKTSTPAFADWFIGDDVTKITRAISTFFTVNLNARDYIITSPIDISVPFSLYGSSQADNFGSKSQTRLIVSGQIDCILNCTKGSTYLSCAIQNVSFTAATGYSRVADGIRFSTPNGPSRPFNIWNCNFKYLNRGVYVYGSNATYSTNLYNLNIKGCNMSLNTYAIYVGGRHGIGGLTVADSVVEQNVSGGIVVVDDSGNSYIAAMGGIEIRNCLLEGEPDPIRIRTDGSVVIADNYFERATGYTQDVYVTGGDATSRANVKISGNYHSNNGASGFTYILRSCDVYELHDSGATSFNVSLSHCVVYGNLDSHNKFTSVTDTMFADWGREPVEDTYVDYLTVKPNIIVNGKAPTLRAVDAWSAGDAYTTNTRTIATGDYRLVCFVRNSYAENTMALTNTNSGGDDFEHNIINPYSNPNKVFKYVHDVTVTTQISGTNKLRFGYRRRGGANTIMGSGLLWFTKGTTIPKYNLENIPQRAFELSDILNPSRHDSFYYPATKSTVIYVVDAWKGLDGRTPALTTGATAERPTNLLSTDAGFQYFDTDLGKYIVWNGTAWVNIDGSALS